MIWPKHNLLYLDMSKRLLGDHFRVECGFGSHQPNMLEIFKNIYFIINIFKNIYFLLLIFSGVSKRLIVNSY